MRAVVAGCLTFALLATACSGDANPSPATSDPASASPSPTLGSSPSPGEGADEHDAAPPAVPLPPRARDNDRGRIAFAEYVLQAWIYALNTNDASPLLDVSGERPCRGCRELATELESRAEEGWYVALRDVSVRSSRVRGEGQVQLRVTVPESDTFYDDGRYRSTNPAHPRSTFEVEVTYTRRGFRLDTFSLY